jgi:hypothetical protein
MNVNILENKTQKENPIQSLNLKSKKKFPLAISRNHSRIVYHICVYLIKMIRNGFYSITFLI